MFGFLIKPQQTYKHFLLLFLKYSLKAFTSPNSCKMEIVEVDTLVCGGGMSGMACAAFAADAGAKTLVVEKQAELGGSSALSAGML